jgi:hypothetical protein
MWIHHFGSRHLRKEKAKAMVSTRLDPTSQGESTRVSFFFTHHFLFVCQKQCVNSDLRIIEPVFFFRRAGGQAVSTRSWSWRIFSASHRGGGYGLQYVFGFSVFNLDFDFLPPSSRIPPRHTSRQTTPVSLRRGVLDPTRPKVVGRVNKQAV